MPRRTKSYRGQRDRQIYREYQAINSDNRSIPAAVLAKRFNVSRQRVYQIIKEQESLVQRNNRRAEMAASGKLPNTETDAGQVAEMLSDLLGGQ
jgi:Mor family transcriptional regulator